MNIKIHFGRPPFDKHPEKSKTQNWAWNNCRVWITFEGLSDKLLAKDFKWMPRDDDIVQLQKALLKCKKLSREKFQEYVESKKKGNKNIDWEVEV